MILLPRKAKSTIGDGYRMRGNEPKEANMKDAILPKIRITQEVYDKISSEAKENYRTINGQINLIFEEWVKAENDVGKVFPA